ncbi:hypothetical protein Mpsy_2395 [Methanolobus psychrophilus R15]|nr:hypothetical protein Mpsy_2395 [Methanolobus psychrophilus R15]
MKTNTIKISDEANQKIKMLMARNDMNFSEAVEFLAMLVPTTSTPKTSKLETELSSIQMQAFNIAEYTQEIIQEFRKTGSFPIVAYHDYVMMCTGMIRSDAEDMRS